MNDVTTIGLDLAKNVFQVHGVDASGETVIRRQLRRLQVIQFFSTLPPLLLVLDLSWGRRMHVLAKNWARPAPRCLKLWTVEKKRKSGQT